MPSSNDFMLGEHDARIDQILEQMGELRSDMSDVKKYIQTQEGQFRAVQFMAGFIAALVGFFASLIGHFATGAKGT